MKKSIVSLLLALLLISCCVISASAATYRYVKTSGGGPIHVWSEPDKSSKKLSIRLAYGTQVRVEKKLSNGFSRITLAGKYSEGYVQSKYLSKTKPSAKAKTTTDVNWKKFVPTYYKAKVVPARTYVNFRWYPSEASASTIKKEMLYGHKLQILATNGTWSQALDESDHTIGFVKNQFLVPDFDDEETTSESKVEITADISAQSTSVGTPVAKDEKITIFTTENGSKVTLEMPEDCYINFVRETENEYVVAKVSKDNVESVTISVSPYGSDLTCSLADLTDEEVATITENIRAEYAEFEDVTITKETTAAGNAYLLVIARSNNVEYNERYTVFEGYNFDRIQVSFTGALTDADRAFMEEVQAGMWVEKTAVTEEVLDAGDTTVVSE